MAAATMSTPRAITGRLAASDVATRPWIAATRVRAQCRGEGDAQAELAQAAPERRLLQGSYGRRHQIAVLGGAVASLAMARSASALVEGYSPAGESSMRENSMEALKGKDYGKTRMKYSDYTSTSSGLQYQVGCAARERAIDAPEADSCAAFRPIAHHCDACGAASESQDLVEGKGETPRPGQQVVVDWDGYTIGYYGRIFEARNKPKGSSFEGNDKDFFRFTLGNNEVRSLVSLLPLTLPHEPACRCIPYYARRRR